MMIIFLLKPYEVKVILESHYLNNTLGKLLDSREPEAILILRNEYWNEKN